MADLSASGGKKDKNCVGNRNKLLSLGGERQQAGLAPGEINLAWYVCAGRIWQPSDVDTRCSWRKYSVMARWVNGKGPPCHPPKTWASRFHSPLEKRFCCGETRPFRWPVVVSLSTGGELKWPWPFNLEIIQVQFLLIHWTASATECISRALSSHRACPGDAECFSVCPSLTSLRKSAPSSINTSVPSKLDWFLFGSPMHVRETERHQITFRPVTQDPGEWAVC